jgi:hypothetical protein
MAPRKAGRRPHRSPEFEMPPMRRKSDLPQKTCAACGRPFVWRKKWEKVWAEVRYCSDRCRAEAKNKR